MSTYINCRIELYINSEWKEVIIHSKLGDDEKKINPFDNINRDIFSILGDVGVSLYEPLTNRHIGLPKDVSVNIYNKVNELQSNTKYSCYNVSHVYLDELIAYKNKLKKESEAKKWKEVIKINKMNLEEFADYHLYQDDDGLDWSDSILDNLIYIIELIANEHGLWVDYERKTRIIYWFEN